MRKQNGICPLCLENISSAMRPCLDHDHVTGYVREVLCSSCNRADGKIRTVTTSCKRNGTQIEWLERHLAYLKKHRDNPSGVFHPDHKTQDEKRLRKNARARAARKQAKENLK